MPVSILVGAYFQDTVSISIYKAELVIHAKSFYILKPDNLTLCCGVAFKNHDSWNLPWKALGFRCPQIHSYW